MDNVTPSPSNHLDSDETSESFSLLAEAVGRFIDAWEAGQGPPSIDQHLADGSQRRMLLVELIKVDLEYRWGQGLEKRVPEYLDDYPELAEPSVPVELLYEEFHARQRAGDSVDPADYATAYPDHAQTIEQWLVPEEYRSTLMVGNTDRDALRSLSAGETVDDFDLIFQLGRGAFAHVYLARQRSMQRLVALKVSADSGAEPQTLAQLDHEAIVRVFDQHLLEDRRLRLLYMQYLPGGTLLQVVQRVRRSQRDVLSGRLLLAVIDQTIEAADRTIEAKGEIKPTKSDQRRMLAGLSWPETVAWIGARLAEGLDYAHRQGVLHRDIKPANVLLTGDGSPKLADFNISFAGGVSGQAPAAYFGGSLAYMSTEHLEACCHTLPRRADDLDGRSDLYSLGVMLWELLTGHKPFLDGKLDGAWSEVVLAMLYRRSSGVEAIEDDPHPSLSRVLRKCLAPDRSQRWQSGQELARQLDLCLDEQARELLDPPPQSWRVSGRRYAVPIILLAILIPNALAALFNAIYNFQNHVQGQSPAVQADFNRMVLLVNGIAFPVGSAVVVSLAGSVVRAINRMSSATPPTANEAIAGRRNCLRLGERCSLMCLSLWTVAGIAHPLAIQSAHGTMEEAEFVHWFGSLIICGLIAVAYPFFGVTYFAVRSLYPALVQQESLGADDQRELLRLN